MSAFQSFTFVTHQPLSIKLVNLELKACEVCELSQTVENQDSATLQAAESRSSKRRILIVAAIAAVALVAFAGVYLGTGYFRPSTQALVWKPKAGDFMVWTATGFDMTMRIEVKTVTADSQTIKTTITSAFGSGTTETVVPLNNTLGSNYDLGNLEAGVAMTDRGTESISTKWGTRSTRHYTVVDNSSPGLSITTDLWIMDKILLKSVQSVSGSTITMVLSDTNVSAVTG